MNSNDKFWEDLRTGKFLSMVKESSKGKVLQSSTEAFNVLHPLFAEEDDIEKAFFVFMDQKNRIISIENLFRGSIAGSAIYPREVVKRLIQNKANGLLVSHNHPSGDPTPSREDKNITMRILIAASSIDACFHDHIIIGETFYSMADQGIMKAMKQKIESFMKAI